MKVLIQNGVVVETCQVDPASVFSITYASQFIEAPDEVQQGWLWDEAGGIYSAPLRPAPTVEDFTNALTAHLDATAQQRRYDNRITCMLRAGFAGPFQVEAFAFATWADACNAMAYKLQAEVQAGTRPMPPSTQALIDVLPPMVWPEV